MMSTKSQIEARKSMPLRKKIREYWAEWLVEQQKFDSVSEVMEAEYCFACGFLSGTEQKPIPLHRAHILALCDGGSNDVSNIHVLCINCHESSEFINGDEYFFWFKNRTIFQRLIEQGVRNYPGGLTSLAKVSGFQETMDLLAKNKI